MPERRVRRAKLRHDGVHCSATLWSQEVGRQWIFTFLGRGPVP